MGTAILSEPISIAAAGPTDDGNGEALYEIVNGQRVELPPMSILAVRCATRLATRMDLFAEEKGLGTVVTEGLFILDAVRNIRRRPDVAFVSKERWPLERPLPERGDWLVVPDLAVESISPTDPFQEVFTRINEYFRCGVRRVWLLLPHEAKIAVYTAAEDFHTLSLGEALDGAGILPGFRVELNDLFKQPAPTA